MATPPLCACVRVHESKRLADHREVAFAISVSYVRSFLTHHAKHRLALVKYGDRKFGVKPHEVDRRFEQDTL